MPGEVQEDSEYQPHWNELITLHEAAKLSELSPNHLRHLVSQGDVWGRKLGRDWFTTELAVKEYLARDSRPGTRFGRKN